MSLVVSLHSYINEFQGKPSFHLFPRPSISDLASLQLSAEHTNWFLSPKFRINFIGEKKSLKAAIIHQVVNQ